MVVSLNSYYRSVVFAFVAIFLWSLSASIAVFLQNDANYVGFTLGILACGAVFFGGWSWYDRDRWVGDLKRNLRDDDLGRPKLRLGASLLGFGLFLLVYDLTFLYSIQEGPSIPANMINYLWPIFFPALGALLFRRSETQFGWYEAGALSVAFGGTALIAGGTEQLLAEGLRYTYLVALLAALSAGIYLNFLSIAQSIVDSTQFIYFVGTIVALPATVLYAVAFDVDVHLTAASVPFVVAYGFVTFGGGQLAWGKAIKLGEDVLISSLAYLTPVLSTIFLAVLVDEPLSETVAFAAVLIIVAQVLLNDSFRHFSSLSGAIVAVFLAALFVYTNPTLLQDIDFFDSLGGVIATIFAIISGFMLNRVWESNQASNERLTEINLTLKRIARHVETERSSLSSAEVEQCHDAIDDLMTSIIDLNYAKRSALSGRYVNRVNRDVADCERTLEKAFQGTSAETVVENEMETLREAVADWLMINQERVSAGEILILALLGVATIITFISAAGETFLSSLTAVFLTGAIVYTILKVRDYNYNQTGSATKVLIEQDVMEDIDRPLYVPKAKSAFDRDLIEAIDDDRTIRIGGVGADSYREVTPDRLETQWYVRYGVFSFVFVAILLVIGLLYLELDSGALLVLAAGGVP